MRRGPHAVLFGQPIRPSAPRVLDAMCRAVRRGDGLCFRGHRKLAADAKVCPRTVRRSQHDLIEAGIVIRYRDQILPSGLCVQSTILHVPTGVRVAFGLSHQKPVPQTLRSSRLVQKLPSEASASQVISASRAPPEVGVGGESRGPVVLRQPQREAVRRQRATFAVVARVTNATALERGAVNAAAKSIRDEHPDLDTDALCREIERRAVAYRRAMPRMLLTPSSLRKHWHRVVAPKSIPRPAHQERERDRHWRNEVGWVGGPKLLDLEIRERLKQGGLIE